MSWDPKALSESFRWRESNAQNDFRRAKLQAPERPAYELLQDEALARIYVFAHLYGNACLESQERFLGHVRNLHQDLPWHPEEALDHEAFARSVRAELKALLKKHGSQETNAQGG